MKRTCTNILLTVGALLSFNSCELMLEDFIGNGFYTPTTNVQTGTNAAQTSFTNGIHWQRARYDANGLPIFGYADGRPVYGYTKQGSLIYQSNLLYSGCYVPSWGTSAAQPYGAIRTSASPPVRKRHLTDASTNHLHHDSNQDKYLLIVRAAADRLQHSDAA